MSNEIQFEAETQSRNWRAALWILVITPIFSCCLTGSLVSTDKRDAILDFNPFLIISGFVCYWAWWCFLTNKTCKLQVGNGQITWSKLFGRQLMQLPLAEIDAVEVNLDDKSYFYLRLTDGQRKLMRWWYRPADFEECIAAIVRAQPAVRVVREHHGTT